MRASTSQIYQKPDFISSDMTYLKQLSTPFNQLGRVESTRTGSMSNLAQMLKMKNARFNFSQQSKETGQDWIRKKGADLNPLLERVQIIKKNALKQQQKKKIQSQCHFYIPKLTYENQEQYVAKNFEFGMLRTVQSIMTIPQDQGNLAKRTLIKRRLERSSNNLNIYNNLPSLNLQIRSPMKKQQYINATKRVLNIQGYLNGIQWTKLYREATKLKFWEIMCNQLTSLFLSPQKNHPISKLAIASLRMVQNILKQQLPLDYSGILQYLTNNYLGKMNKLYDSDGTMGPVWAISFMLYRAGRKQQFYESIQSQEIRKYFQQADKSIQSGNPTKFAGLEQGSDVFYNQLIYALKGTQRCQSDYLCSPNSVDVVWVFLRNVGIFPQDQGAFENLRKKLFQYYKQNSVFSALKVQNMLYLLGYIQIAEFGINQIMDQDDYLHYLIALYHSPISDFIQKQKKQFLERRLTERLVYYIQELILENKEDYIYYVALMPQSKIPQQISSIIASSNLIESFNWRYLSQKLPRHTFQKLVHTSTLKYAAFHQNYIQVTRKLCELIDNGKIALDFLINMVIKSILTKKVNFEELTNSQQLAQKIMQKDENLRTEYYPIFGFFAQFRKIASLVKQRDQYKIFAFLGQCTHILISDQLKIQTKLALQKLVQHGGFQCYMHYLKILITAYQISLTRLDRNDDLKELQGLTLAALLLLIRTQPYTRFANKDTVKQVITILQDAVIVK